MLNLTSQKALRNARQYLLCEDGQLSPVPVLINGTPRCSIAITYISSALRASEAKRRYLGPLTNAAAEK